MRATSLAAYFALGLRIAGTYASPAFTFRPYGWQSDRSGGRFAAKTHSHTGLESTDYSPPHLDACGTEISAENLATFEKQFRKQRKAHRAGDEVPNVVIPVNFYIIMANETVGGGYVSDQQIEAQMEVMNAAFSPAGISWQHISTKRVINPLWFHNVGVDQTDAGIQLEMEMKASFSTGDPDVLDVYSTGLGMGNLLGYVRLLPWRYSEDPILAENRAGLDGAIITWLSFPNGPLPQYFLGYNLVHEVGHWAGLAHTFNSVEGPGTCEGPGDYVSDTPVQAYAAHLTLDPAGGVCLAYDTCADQPGIDPINNFMDYAPEPCKTEFTPGQIARMRDVLALYREIET
ncbi:hypothetical protein FA15DRAFT_710101 [Coprinopsis marcescibilis]|uniref:Peptidase M43 pregnancy-associated plasma-A domain-containing protein n=1 Tax=Coprinopsis marcescibilis TaxID=230819 RepID=A0A5C3KDV6_COPMA|nr:hypothetical protein FA15DRAFT_710101 [Coprinopsis marcescibilis]